MKALLIILLVIAIIVIVALVLRSKRKTKPDAEPPRGVADPYVEEPVGTFGYSEHGDLMKVKPGDHVDYLGMSNSMNQVLGVITCTDTQSGSVWKEIGFDDGSWISVEPSPTNAEITEWEGVVDSDLRVLIPRDTKKIVFRGQEYHLNNDGYGTFVADGTTDTPNAGHLEYWEYATADKSGFLSFERFALTKEGLEHVAWDITLGEAMAPSGLTVYPGS